jgi:F-type H+-transporting ATPase subunit b
MLHELVSGHEFWVAIAFIIAVGVLVYKAGPSITAALDARAAKIKAELDEAQRLREDAQRTLADYQRKQRDALKEAEQIVALSKVDAERVAAHLLQNLEAALQLRRKAAVEKIERAEASALTEVRAVMADFVIAETRWLLVEQLGKERGSELIDEAISELPLLVR